MARKGLLGRKLGMTQVFDEDARAIPVTVVQAGPCTVTQVKTEESDGYRAVQLAFGRVKPKRVPRPLRGHLEKAGLEAAEVLAEVRLEEADELPELGALLTCDLFTAGELVDVTGTSKGKGFAGVMKRHGFAGLSASHGTKKKDRHPGAIGACATPGRTFKGQRMAGRLGGQRVTIQNLTVVEVEAEEDLLLIKGAVPGSNGSVVMVRSAARAPVPAGAGGEG